MKRAWWLAFPLFVLTACVPSGDQSTTKSTTVKTGRSPGSLGVGDPAPALVSIKWLNGTAVPNFESGKIYVLDFWATWCGPCIQIMPHLAELQKEYQDRGVVFIGVTTADAQNPATAVEKFVKQNGAKFNFRFALSDADDNERNFMQASGSNSIPRAFVIDASGKIAYIGHSMNVSEVIPKLLDGTWNGKEDANKIERVIAEWQQVMGQASRKPAAALSALIDFEKAHPEFVQKPSSSISKLYLLMQAEELKSAKIFSESLIDRFTKEKNAAKLQDVRKIWCDPKLNPDNKHLDLAQKAAEEALKLAGENDAPALDGMAEVWHALGDSKKAVAFGEKAVEKAEGEPAKKQLRDKLDKYKK